VLALLDQSHNLGLDLALAVELLQHLFEVLLLVELPHLATDVQKQLVVVVAGLRSGLLL